jgi:hypothetical protein
VNEFTGNAGIESTAMLTKLNDVFSNEAVKRRFWNLDFIKRLLNNK